MNISCDAFCFVRNSIYDCLNQLFSGVSFKTVLKKPRKWHCKINEVKNRDTLILIDVIQTSKL